MKIHPQTLDKLTLKKLFLYFRDIGFIIPNSGTTLLISQFPTIDY
jgi:hypothetical protein